jgi:hypothetical protein
MVSSFVSNLPSTGLPAILIQQLETLGFSLADIKGLESALSGQSIKNPVLLSDVVADQAGDKAESQLSADLVQDAAKLSAKYDFVGFFPPLSQKPVFREGKSIPIEFTLYQNHKPVKDALAGLQVYLMTNGSLSPVAVAMPGGKHRHSDLFRHEQDSAEYEYDLKTEGYTAGNYLIVVTLDDASIHQAQFTIRERREDVDDDQE